MDTALAPGPQRLREGRGGALGRADPEQVPAPHGWLGWLCPQGQVRERGPAGTLPGAWAAAVHPLTSPRQAGEVSRGPGLASARQSSTHSFRGSRAGGCAVCFSLSASPCQHCGRRSIASVTSSLGPGRDTRDSGLLSLTAAPAGREGMSLEGWPGLGGSIWTGPGQGSSCPLGHSSPGKPQHGTVYELATLVKVGTPTQNN